MNSHTTDRKLKRLENKKRKLGAYLKLAESNDRDRKKKRNEANPSSSKEDDATELQKIAPSQGEKEEPPTGASLETKRKLSAEEYAELRKRKKERDKAKLAWPRMFLNGYGEQSSLIVEAGKRVPLLMSDIQSLILYSLIHNKSPTQPRWARVMRTRKFSHVVAVLIEGMGLSDIIHEDPPPKGIHNGDTNPETENEISEDQNVDSSANSQTENCSRDSNVRERRRRCPEWLTDKLPRTGSLMHFNLELLAPSKYDIQAADELLNVPLSFRAMQSKEFKDLAAAERSGVVQMSLRALFPMTPSVKGKKENSKIHFDRRTLLLSPQDMFEYSFPSKIPGCPGYNNPEFVFTSDNYTEVTANSPMFAVDCEMCMTTTRNLELTRISVVNEKLELVYHTLVKPHNRIINYLTRFSGITAEMLANVTTRLSNVQRDVKELLPPDAILVGHSLDSDLKAMKMMHPYVIDSSLVYNLSSVRRKRSSLKKLAQMFLDLDIQNSTSGHDPTEDAGASLRLVQLKLQHDMSFGDVIQGWHFSSTQYQEEEQGQDYKKNTESAVELSYRYVTSVFQHGITLQMAMLTTPLCMKTYQVMMKSLSKVKHLEVLPGNKQISQRTAELAISNDFTYVHMQMGTRLSQCQEEETRQLQLTKLDKRLARIHQGAAPKALIIYIFSGSAMDISADQRSNGFVMLGIKDMPFEI